MERIYCDEIYRPTTKEANRFLLELYDYAKMTKEHFDEDAYRNFVSCLYNSIRKKYNLPNKMLAIAINKDETEACIALFPKEPDGSYYKTSFDKELNRAYILIDSIKE